MGLKSGLVATTSAMALLAITGCDRWSEESVTRDAQLTADTPSMIEPICDAVWEACVTPRVAFLKTPDNVVYTTRAGVTPDADFEDLEADNQNSAPTDAAPAPESADNTE